MDRKFSNPGVPGPHRDADEPPGANKGVWRPFQLRGAARNETSRMLHAGPRISYGWWIVARGTLTYALGYGARYGLAVIFPSLVKEFGWSRDVTATVLSSHMIVYGLVAPVVGGLVDRFGAKPTMSLGFLMLSSGLALSSLGSSPWHFWSSFGLLFGEGFASLGPSPSRCWFATGSRGKGGWPFPSCTWDPGDLTRSILPCLGSWRCGVGGELLWERSEDGGTVRDGGPEPGTTGPRQPMGTAITASPWGNTEWILGKAMTQGRFWFMCVVTFSLWGIMQHILMAHNVPCAVDLGLSRMRVSSILSLVGVAYVAGALSAPISDRIGREATPSA